MTEPLKRYPPVAPVGDYSYYHRATTTVGAAIGDANPKRLHAVTINNVGATATITLYDGQSTAGTVIAVISPVAGGTYIYDVIAVAGLFIVVSAGTAPDITVSYR